MHRQANAVIGQPVLREVVRANPLRTIAGTDLILARRRFRLGPLLLVQVIQLGAQLHHRLGFILVLAALVLALHNRPGRQMGDAHRRVRFVDVLTARAARALPPCRCLVPFAPHTDRPPSTRCRAASVCGCRSLARATSAPSRTQVRTKRASAAGL